MSKPKAVKASGGLAPSAVLRSPLAVVEERAKTKGTTTKSDKMWQSVLSRKKRSPVVLSMDPPRFKLVKTSEYHLLEVDMRYQRDIQPEEVADLIQVLKKGGSIADPITLAQRRWTDDYSKPGKYYIADGQQRALAYMECEKEIPAMIYQTDSLEQERTLFVVMNTKISVHPNAIVQSYAGHLAQCLREVNADPSHPLFRRIHFRPGTSLGARNFMASSLAKAAASVVTGIYDSARRIGDILGKADALLKTDPAARARLDAYLHLVGQVFSPGDYVKVLGMHSLAIVAHRKWSTGAPSMPSGPALKRLQSLKWDDIILGYKALYRPVSEGAIQAAWK